MPDGDDSKDERGGNGDVEELKSANAQQLHRAVREEGQEELERPTASLFWSGLAGGRAITASLIAEAAIAAHTARVPGRPLLIAFGYPIGFVMVILGRMQLFTESTVTAMLPLVSKLSVAALFSTLRLRGVVPVANPIGTAQAFGGFLVPAVLGNLVGGAGLFALLAHAQVRGEGV